MNNEPSTYAAPRKFSKVKILLLIAVIIAIVFATKYAIHYIKNYHDPKKCLLERKDVHITSVTLNEMEEVLEDTDFNYPEKPSKYILTEYFPDRYDYCLYDGKNKDFYIRTVHHVKTSYADSLFDQWYESAEELEDSDFDGYLDYHRKASIGYVVICGQIPEGKKFGNFGSGRYYYGVIIQNNKEVTAILYHNSEYIKSDVEIIDDILKELDIV